MTPSRFTTLLLLLVPSAALADPSPVAIGQRSMLGFSVAETSGSRPVFAAGAVAYDQLGYWLELRGGASGSSGDTALGTQLGVEYGLGLGVTPRESNHEGDRTPLAARGRLALALRAVTFDLPVEGMVSFRLGFEGATGGAHWWSDTARLAPVIGSRLAVQSGKNGRGELEYELLPVWWGGAPDALSVHRLEHRLGLTIGAGSVGLRFQVALSDERTTNEEGSFSRTTSRTLSLGLEWRQ